MKSIVIAAVVAVGMAAAGTASAQEALAKSSGCLNCHDVATKKMGPAFKEVAAKYKGDAGAPAKLATKVKAGGTGTWGQIPMPPNPSVSDADMKTLIAYVLADNRGMRALLEATGLEWTPSVDHDLGSSVVCLTAQI